MKEKLNLRNFVAWGAALLVIIAFFVSFGAGLKGTLVVESMSASVSMKGLAIGSQSMIGTVYGFEVPVPWPYTSRAALSIVGMVLALLAALAVVVVTFLLPEKMRKMVVIGCGAVVVIGAVFLLLLKVNYVPTLAKEAGEDKDLMKELFKDLSLNGSAIAAAIMMILGGGAMVASELVIKK